MSEILLNKYKDFAKGDREETFKNGLEFMLSKESIQGFGSLSNQIYNNFDDIVLRFCALVIDREDYFTKDSISSKISSPK